AIGVGQYQHDVNQKNLAQTLVGVVEDCVNSVGVDLNTASPSLLKYISGISPSLAKNIVSFRESVGVFSSREQLKKVPRLGPAAFVQCAGFLRIADAENVLDNTQVHPESYSYAETFLKEIGGGVGDVSSGRILLTDSQISEVAKKLGCGVPTLRDIYEALRKPGRDPREDAPGPVFRSDVLSIEDIGVGMVLTGVVRNVIDFGAFVDIGVKQDGLVHISEIADRYIRHPSDVLKVGDVKKVRVISIDTNRKRIGLSMKGTDSE
ncbi:MAG: helix-hairpin-helix domain-containing protein, partial [bacterium]|nr:helix-hairpin-helix domain-containing protein [bacterium]